MTEEAQRIAIAEVCGWRPVDDGLTGRPPFTDDSIYQRTGNKMLPDYLNDRNAMWDAAESAGEATVKAMRFWLFTICGEMKAHHASAAQEAEAFLRAKGLWVE